MLTDEGVFEISASQARQMLDLAKVGKKDVFLDLGSGSGLPVRMAVTYRHATMAIGVECEPKSYERARINAIRALSKTQLERVDFWLGFTQNDDNLVDGKKRRYVFDYSKATVLYNSLDEDAFEKRLYDERINRRRTRIVKKDLPLIGYKPLDANRNSATCWFFLMKYPLRKMRSRDEWAQAVMGTSSATIRDVYRYYRRRLRERDVPDAEIEQSIRRIGNLLRQRIPRK